MHATKTILAVLSALTAVMAQGNLVINSPPSLSTCVPAAVTFSGGTAPYYIRVLPGGQSGAAALQQFPTQTAAGSYTWTVDLPAGTSVTLSVTDSTGNINYSAPLTILQGGSTACIGAASSSSAAPGSSSSAAPGGTSSSAPPSSSTSRASSSSAPSSSAPSSSAPPATSAATTPSATGTTAAPAATTSRAAAGKLSGFNALALGAAAVVAVVV